MSLDKITEAKIREAMERGELDNLPGRGKPLNLDVYFNTPEELRMAYSLLRNAGIVPEEVELLQQTAALRERLSGTDEEAERSALRKQISEAQMRYGLLMERRKL